MNNQKLTIQQSITFGNLGKHLKGTISLYIFTLGSAILGFSVYLFLSTITLQETSYVSWTGEALFWGLIFFLISIFILFLPIEFSNTFYLFNDSFNDLVINIISTILTSLFFLIFFQIVIPSQITILNEISIIARSVSFSGFIVIPISFFILNNLPARIKFFKDYNFSTILFLWVISLQLFL